MPHRDPRHANGAPNLKQLPLPLFVVWILQLSCAAADGKSSGPRNFFQVLNIEPAPKIELPALKSAYRKAALEVHPDKCVKGSAGKSQEECHRLFIRVSKAYECLRDRFCSERHFRRAAEKAPDLQHKADERAEKDRQEWEKWHADMRARMQEMEREAEEMRKRFAEAAATWNQFMAENEALFKEINMTLLRVDAAIERAEEVNKRADKVMEDVAAMLANLNLEGLARDAGMATGAEL
eukprot:TRINITY_DN24975_c0_g1_i1.p1 TRINITY_DN24975_c0_g1~~TRINITY_DN24975_c0_g1_i1.p1  ORF type:complete len:261 (+),score=71.01 TRINITY_DN24975_c0_g1_i1:70-783(+)